MIKHILYWILSAAFFCLTPLVQAETTSQDAYVADGTPATANTNLCNSAPDSPDTGPVSTVTTDTSGIANPLLTALCQSTNAAFLNLKSAASAAATSSNTITKSDIAHSSITPTTPSVRPNY